MPDDFNPDEIAAWIERKAKKDPKLGKVLENARLFGALKAEPGWQKLNDIVKAQKRKMIERLAQRLWEHPETLPDPVELAYAKGFYHGAQWIVSHPEHAEAGLDRVARAAWLLDSTGALNDEEADA